MGSDKNDFKEFSIRVPADLDELIRQDAAQNKRSKSKQVNYVLEEHYADKKTENSEKQQTAN